MRHTRAIVVAAVLLSAAMAAAAAAQLVGEAFDNPGLPLWMQQCVVKASFEPAGYLEYVVLGNSSWVDAVSMQGSPLSIHVDALSWRCAPASAGESE